MQELISEPLVSLLTSASTSILTGLGRRALASEGVPSKIRQFFSLSRDYDEAIEQRLKAALLVILPRYELAPILGRGAIVAALKSPEILAVVRGALVNGLTNPDLELIEKTKKRFVDLCTAGIKYPDDRLQGLCRNIFEALLEAFAEVLRDATNDGILAAHETLDAMRYIALRGELESLKRILSQPPLANSTDEYIEFLARYRRQMHHHTSQITPPQLNSSDRVHIDEIFVEPILEIDDERKDKSKVDITFSQMYHLIFRTVILGDPGGGKSTLAGKIAHVSSSLTSQVMIGGRDVTPILIILRDYSSQDSRQRLSFVEYIAQTANSQFQLPTPSGALEWLLQRGSFLVIFDGLDELLDTSERRRITESVELFCNLYPSTPVLVTSRRQGYFEAPLRRDMFEPMTLSSLPEPSIQLYAQKWFRLINPENREHADRLAKAFVAESVIAPDLRRNPLMLGLMCNLYRSISYIPQNRPDVFKKCAELLFERWDRRRGIRVPLEFESHLFVAISYLAYWMYTDKAARSGVTAGRITAKMLDYLVPRLYEDREKAERAAYEFVEFCKGRAWVFSDVGTTPNGEEIYQFTHLTFREYFAARYLVRHHRTPGALLSVLGSRVRAEEWDIVCQMAFQIMAEEQEGAADELLDGLLSGTIDCDSSARMNVQGFAARALNFLVPSPPVRRQCVQILGDYYSNRCSSILSRTLSEFGSPRNVSAILQRAVPEAITALLQPAKENRETVADEVIRRTESLLTQSDERIICLGIEAFLCLGFLSIGARVDNMIVTDRLRKHFEEKWLEAIRPSYGHHARIAFLLEVVRESAWRQFLRDQGPKYIYMRYHFYLGDIGYPCMAQWMLWEWLGVTGNADFRICHSFHDYVVGYSGSGSLARQLWLASRHVGELDFYLEEFHGEVRNAEASVLVCLLVIIMNPDYP